MKHMIRFGSAMLLAVSAALLAQACTKNTSNGPSPSTTTTTAATTTVTTTTTATTTSVQATFTVSGTVTDAKTGQRVNFADIEIIQGINVGRRFQGDASGGYTMIGLLPGTLLGRFG